MNIETLNTAYPFCQSEYKGFICKIFSVDNKIELEIKF